jgi:membrane associated rhomboid family serine protease
MYGNSIFDDFKHAFNRPNNGLIRIILLNIIAFVVVRLIPVPFWLAGYNYDLIRDTIDSWLVLPSSLQEFIIKPWTLVTYFFMHAGFFHILFNMLFLYWFGRIIHEFLGNEKVVNLFVLGGLAGGLFYMIIYNVLPIFSEAVNFSYLIGASAGVYAVVVGAATFMPDYAISLILIGPVRIKYIALFYIVLSIIQMPQGNAGGELAHLAGAAIGFIFIKQLRRGNDMGKPINQFFLFVKSLFKKQPKVKVTYTNSTRRATRRNFKSNQEEIDAILDKISESGYDSLTKEEKQKLFDASKSNN